jgi:hypothetical protein
MYRELLRVTVCRVFGHAWRMTMWYGTPVFACHRCVEPGYGLRRG